MVDRPFVYLHRVGKIGRFRLSKKLKKAMAILQIRVKAACLSKVRTYKCPRPDSLITPCLVAMHPNLRDRPIVVDAILRVMESGFGDHSLGWQVIGVDGCDHLSDSPIAFCILDKALDDFGGVTFAPMLAPNPIHQFGFGLLIRVKDATAGNHFVPFFGKEGDQPVPPLDEVPLCDVYHPLPAFFFGKNLGVTDKSHAFDIAKDGYHLHCIVCSKPPSFETLCKK